MMSLNRESWSDLQACYGTYVNLHPRAATKPDRTGVAQARRLSCSLADCRAPDSALVRLVFDQRRATVGWRRARKFRRFQAPNEPWDCLTRRTSPINSCTELLGCCKSCVWEKMRGACSWATGRECQIVLEPMRKHDLICDARRIMEMINWPTRMSSSQI